MSNIGFDDELKTTQVYRTEFCGYSFFKENTTFSYVRYSGVRKPDEEVNTV